MRGHPAGPLPLDVEAAVPPLELVVGVAREDVNLIGPLGDVQHGTLAGDRQSQGLGLEGPGHAPGRRNLLLRPVVGFRR